MVFREETRKQGVTITMILSARSGPVTIGILVLVIGLSYGLTAKGTCPSLPATFQPSFFNTGCVFYDIVNATLAVSTTLGAFLILLGLVMKKKEFYSS